MTDELATLDATALAEQIRNGKISPREAVQAAIARIDRLNPELNAVIHPLYDRALQLADSEDLPEGPLRGVPFLLKDLDGFSEGDPWHAGMRLLRDAGYLADHDSFQIAKLKASGLIVVGKTNTPELGLTITTEPEAYGATHNPWNLDHSTGGSSGGSAAAVASGMVPAAHGGDGGGSIRIPASECGLVGLKPSRGRVSLGPDFGSQWHGFVCEHALSRSVRDCALLLDIGSGAMPGDPYVAPDPERPFVHEVGADPGVLRVGLMLARPDGEPLHSHCTEAVRRAGSALESLGHRVEVSHPAAMEEVDDFRTHFTTIVGSWTASLLSQIGRVADRPLGPSDVEAGTWALAAIGQATSAESYLDSVIWIESWSRRMARFWSEGFDLLVTPTLGEPPPPLGYLAPDARNPLQAPQRLFSLMAFAPQFNATGQPAISLPLHWSPEGLPIGVQMVGASHREDLLLQVAAQLEEALPWRDRRPPVFAA
ncbi:MAG: amidase [Myxococcota bacterium]